MGGCRMGERRDLEHSDPVASGLLRRFWRFLRGSPGDREVLLKDLLACQWGSRNVYGVLEAPMGL